MERREREIESVLEGVKGNEQQVKIEIYDVEGHSPATGVQRASIIFIDF